jgi:hypothetical protein
VRSDPHDLLAGGQQSLLKPPRDKAAILDRPHPLLIQASGPADRGKIPRLISFDLPLATDSPVPSSTAASACEPLCVSAPITIICTVPFV